MHWSRRIGTGVVLWLGACGGAGPAGTPSDEVECSAAAIIGGEEADDPALGAIGALIKVDAQGTHLICSGTLIAPAVVLSAKHCAVSRNSAPLSDESTVFFAVGGDVERPRQIVQVVASESSTPNQGGVAELGSDVAVLHLKEPVVGVDPLPISNVEVSDGLVGAPLRLYGFGTDLARCPSGTPYRAIRRIGVETLRAVRGNVFDLIYGDYQSFVDQAREDHEAFDFLGRYEKGVLLERYEAWLAALPPGSAQTCFGDSGGPVTIEREGQVEVLGVTSWGWRSANRVCDGGTVIAVIGAETRAFLSGILGP